MCDTGDHFGYQYGSTSHMGGFAWGNDGGNYRKVITEIHPPLERSIRTPMDQIKETVQNNGTEPSVHKLLHSGFTVVTHALTFWNQSCHNR